MTIKPKSPWRDWSGGECPVATTAIVECKRRDGRMDAGYAGALCWGRTGWRPDVIRYRVVESHDPKDYEEPQLIEVRYSSCFKDGTSRPAECTGPQLLRKEWIGDHCISACLVTRDEAVAEWESKK